MIQKRGGDLEYAFANDYQIELFEYLSGYYVSFVENGFVEMQTNRFVCGVKNNEPYWKQFENNIRYMKMLCEDNGIRYLAFLQPALPVKEKISAAERELVLNTDCFSVAWMESCKAFYRHKDDFCRYMTDLSYIFDSSNVYLDICHVNVKGNNIIAEAILKELEKKYIGVVKEVTGENNG